MADYQKMYLTLFNKITDTIKNLEEIQQLTEEMYISEEQPKISLSPQNTQQAQSHAPRSAEA